MKNLIDLFYVEPSLQNLTITDIVDDSRKASPDCMFVAIKGNCSDGNAYILDAISKGAKFILQGDESLQAKRYNVETKDDIVYITVPNVRKELARICSIFWPRNFEHAVAVTGTNGKSSTVDIVRQIWINSGKEAASIGTLGVITKDSIKSTSLTSPGPIDLRHFFSDLKATHIAMEASSHGLNQYRLDNINFDVCAFTNFTQDHLDYHKNFENYWKAKERLFSELGKKTFVINADDDKCSRILEIAKERGINCITYGKHSEQIKLVSVQEIDQYQQVTILFNGKEITFDLSLAGEFQVYNTLCAMGICYATGIPIDQICSTLSKLTPINGRLELVGQKNEANIYIDYAHTPDALKNALISLRNHTKNKLAVVFGCGGNRDKDKRCIMGHIANDYADKVVVTDDNPRKENPQTIRNMILKGCPEAKEIGNRAEALKFAIQGLHPGDILLVAGKGHEDYQILAEGKIHFSDKEVILEEIR